MRIDPFVLAEEEAALKAQQTKRIVRNYKDISFTLAVTFFAVEVVGFLAAPLAGIALTINVLLGLVVIYRAAVGIFTLDIIQELLPASKKEEIPSWQYIGRVAIAVSLFWILLVLRVYLPFNLKTFLAFVVFFAIAVFASGMGTPQAKRK